MEKASELDGALQEMLAHPGPALLDVVTAKQELAMPPQIKFEQAKGFSLYMLRAIINGRGDEVVELAKPTGCAKQDAPVKRVYDAMYPFPLLTFREPYAYRSTQRHRHPPQRRHAPGDGSGRGRRRRLRR